MSEPLDPNAAAGGPHLAPPGTPGTPAPAGYGARHGSPATAEPDYEPPPPSGPPVYQPPPAYAPGADPYQPPYGSAPYGSAPYGSAPYGSAPYGNPHVYPALDQSPEPSHRRRWLSIAVVVAGLLGAGIFVSVHYAFADHRKSLRLPLAAGNYSEISSVTGSQFAAVIRSRMSGAEGSAAEKVFSKAKVGVYGRGTGGTPELVFIGISAKDSAALRDAIDSSDYGSEVTDTFAGVGPTTPTTEDAGPLGGALKCASVTVDSTSASVCVWVDHSSLGMILVYDETDLTANAATTRAFRAAAEY